MDTKQKLELYNVMVATLEDAIENPREHLGSICNLDVEEFTFMLCWYFVFSEGMQLHFENLGYHCHMYPIEDGDISQYIKCFYEGTHWTHPEYGPKRIDLAKKLLLILKEKKKELENK